MKIAGIDIPFTTLKNPKPNKVVVIRPDVARIQRELDYQKRLGKTRHGTTRLEKRIKNQKRGSFGQ